MIDFDNTMDELGDFYVTKADLNKKWTTLREDWETLVKPYAVPTFIQDPDWQYGMLLGPNKVGRQPPEFLLKAYLAWRDVHKNYLRSFAHDPIFSLAGAWIDKLTSERRRYIRAYNKLFPGTPEARTSIEEQREATSPRDITRGDEPDSSGASWFPDFGKVKIDLGNVALIGLAGFLAYNVFFRSREGRRIK